MSEKKFIDLSFYKGKKVFITGNTGFKGTWLCKVLLMAGADITGYALEPPTTPNLYNLTGMKKEVNTFSGDVRDYAYLQRVFKEVHPEIVIHLAAQPIVRESYRDPRETYETNIMGTVNVCECIRNTEGIRSFLNVTTDKVYQNNEWEWGYRETDILNGSDPYSNSKSCSELVTHSYIHSFFANMETAVSTARAGNVIGGGDFSADRIVPDCVRAAMKGERLAVRNPYSIRPYQHVLDPLFAYLLIAKGQYEKKTLADAYNVGPDYSDCITTGDLVALFSTVWKKHTGEEMEWHVQSDCGPHEAGFLQLDCSRIKRMFGWRPVWNIVTAIDKVVEWSEGLMGGHNINVCMEKQIKEFLNTDQ